MFESLQDSQILKFKYDFLTSKCCKSIFYTEGMMLVALVGSYGMHINDEKSDWDLLCITTTEEQAKKLRNHYMQYNNKRVHWYAYSYLSFIKASWQYPGFHTRSHPIAVVQFNNIMIDNILYINANYENEIQELIKIRGTLADFATQRYIQYLSSYIKCISENLPFQYTKRCYQLAWLAGKLQEKSTQADALFLCRLKRLDVQELSLEDRLELQRRCEYLLRHNSTFKQEIKYQQYKELVKQFEIFEETN